MKTAEPMTKLIAFYLPQFHPIPENDRWWGKGFTEWTNVARASPRFRGHYQPQLPADLGFYDLRVPETREAQAEMAREYGIHGFCYYGYWFKGHRLLERPFDEVLRSGRPDFPFCLCWPNENWTRVWDGGVSDLLIEQQYSAEDDIRHIQSLFRAFEDPRYIRIEGRPLFLVWRARQLPDPVATTERWRNETRKAGIGELFLCRVESHDERGDPREVGFDASLEFNPRREYLVDRWRQRFFWRKARRLRLAEQSYGNDEVYSYARYVEEALRSPHVPYPRFPSVFPAWDNSSRRKGVKAMILRDSTPELYERWLMETIRSVESGRDRHKFVFINAWNEWAEGAHLEPCQKWGRAYLEATRRAHLASRRQLTTVDDVSLAMLSTLSDS